MDFQDSSKSNKKATLNQKLKKSDRIFFQGLFSVIAECFPYQTLYDSFLFEFCPGQAHI